MSIFDKIFGKKPQTNDAARLYEHDKTNKRHPQRQIGAHSADAVMHHTRGKIRDSARWLDENNAIAVSVMEALVTNIVGDGTKVEPMVLQTNGQLAKETNLQLKKAFDDFMQYPDATGELYGCEFEEKIVTSWLRDGEIFLQHIRRGTDYDWQSDLQYTVELLESEFVPFDTYIDMTEYVHGVRKNDWGKPVEYLVYVDHPHNTYGLAKTTLQTRKISAENIIHLKNTRRARQTRGISILAPVIDTLLDLSDYEQSERVAARVNAAQTIAIKKQLGSGIHDTDEDGVPNYQVAPFSVWHLQAGEDVTAIKADRPNPNLDPFVQSQIRRVAAATMTGYSTVSRNYNGTYSAQRQELIEMDRFYKRLRKIYYQTVLKPIYREVVQEAVRVRNIPLVGIDNDTIFDVDFRGQGLFLIDPAKEAAGAKTDIEMGLRSRQQIIRERGGDPEQITKEITQDEFQTTQAAEQENGENQEVDDNAEDRAIRAVN